MMQPIFAQGNARTLQRLKTFRQQAQTEKAPRVALRLEAIMLSVQGQTSGQIARGLQVDRTRVHAWIGAWNEYGDEGLLAGHRSGRPAELNAPQRERLGDILDSGPVAHGLNTGVWTSPLIADIIAEEFDVTYHPGQGRRLLKQLTFSVPRPKTRLVQADPKKQNRGIRYTHPNLKKNARREGAVIVYEDEASFRQTPTLDRTWARRGQQPLIPTRGERHTQKILGAVGVPDGDFVWRHQTEYFNGQTYLSFLDGALPPHFYRRRHRVYLIQDNASYHKKPEVLEFFARPHRQIQVFLLPSYSPDFNAQERLWHHTRQASTHNRYFDQPAALCQSLFTTFTDIPKTSRETPRAAHALFLRLVCRFIYTRTCSEFCLVPTATNSIYAWTASSNADVQIVAAES